MFKYTKTVNRLRYFFDNLGFQEVLTQQKVGIVNVVNQPYYLDIFQYRGQLYPCPQTSRYHLSHDLVHLDLEGVYSLSTSYTDNIEPVFEFEFRGRNQKLINIQSALCRYLNLPPTINSNLKTTFDNYPYGKYSDMCKKYRTPNVNLSNLKIDFGPVFLLQNSDFLSWDSTANTSVIIDGKSVMFGTEKCCDNSVLETNFHSSVFPSILSNYFDVGRIERDLDKYLAIDFPEHAGCTIKLEMLDNVLEKLTK